MKTDARIKNRAKEKPKSSLWQSAMEKLPRRITFIIGDFKDDQPRQLAEAIDKIKKHNRVIIIESNEEVKIKKVWI